MMNVRQYFSNIPGPLIRLAVFSSILLADSAMASMQGRPGFQLNNIDHTIAATDDFYTHANGNWLIANPIPDEESRWGTFNILRSNNTRQVRYILEAAAENTVAAAGSEIKKIGDFYATGLNTEKADRLGLTPIRPELDMINDINNLYDLQMTLQHFQLHGIDAMFNIGQMQDFQNSKRIITVFDQGGLGLPERDYYFRQDTKTLNIRNAYLRHIATLFRMLGQNDQAAHKSAKTVIAIETELARLSLNRAERRDPAAIYHLLNKKKLNTILPSFKWKTYFSRLDLSQAEEINITNPDYFHNLENLLHQYPISAWKNYLRWRLLDTTARTLSAPFVNQNFAFKSRLSGSKEIKPRWRRVTDETNRILGFAVGHIYVDLYFPASSKNRVIDILENIRNALEVSLNENHLLTTVTKRAAIEKLNSMRSKIAYPASWRDYTDLVVTRDSYARNLLNGNAFLIRRELNKIGKQTTRNEWLMTPQSVNAYYNPSMNEIVFPAGILQPPFFDSAVPEALNYGAIGAVIGHEISHGFDDQGSHFDARGNLKNWWSRTDKNNFSKAAACISKQFDGYTVDGDAHIQGKLVTGEAIADLLGLTLAWQAFINTNNSTEIDPEFNLNAAKLFYFGFAHVWAGAARPEYLRTSVQTDPHPPALFRVNGTLINFPPFMETFNTKPGDKLYKPTPCKIW